MNTADAGLVGYIAAAEGALVLLAFTVLLVHGALANLRAGRDSRRLVLVRRVLARTVPSGGVSEPLLDQAVGGLSARLRVRLLADVVPSLTGGHRSLLAGTVAGTGLAAQASTWCRSRFWRRRLRGLRLLSLMSTGSELAVELLRDPHERVRAQAVAWVCTNPSSEAVEPLLDMLASPNGTGAFLPKDALVRIGRPVVEPLVRFLSAQQGPPRAAGLEVAILLAEPRLMSSALAASEDACGRNRALAAALVSALGGEDGLSRLVEMLADADPAVRAASVKGLGACAYWRSAPQVAPLLRDRAWVVRSETAQALASMGGPGLLFLRRALGDEDPFARDAVRRVLDLPDPHHSREAG